MDYVAAQRFGTKLTREILEGKKAPLSQYVERQALPHQASEGVCTG